MARPTDHWRLPGGDRWLTLEAAAALLFAAIAVRTLPFRWIIKWSGSAAKSLQHSDVSLHPIAHSALPGQIGNAVKRAARHLPLTLLCLPQALAANWMLRRRGVAASLHFGVALCEGPVRRMRAHAWLTVGQQSVIGVAGSQAFVEVARFSDEAPDRSPES
ncbi:Transglutaminase-like superfamily protein [Pseudomonas asturiensis]|uniref:Transglutaminase-like superfamily protein n=1 Tax=Pseudomonas asturiensis TaxID=1190415 RepID=A0A1M7JTH1_9PSED|nr:lasso peptide biosynthesis B2 protein [Pseudomonas asturiensis]SHM56359.1 Transglutaminase-like superfamily protein [Pseudomonas asturiensis]